MAVRVCPIFGRIGAVSSASSVYRHGYSGGSMEIVPEDIRELAAAIDAACRIRGEFTLRSGLTTDEYFDKYRFEGDPQLLRRVAERMVPLLPSDTQVLGGLELGGVPIATMVSALTGLPAIFVRKQAKTYCTRKLAEGPSSRLAPSP